MRVQAFVAETAIEGLRLAWAREVQGDGPPVGSVVEDPRYEFWTVVHPDAGRGRPALELQALHHRHYIIAPDALVNVDGQAFPREGVHHRQRPEPRTVEQIVGDEVHHPNLIGSVRRFALLPPRGADVPAGGVWPAGSV